MLACNILYQFNIYPVESRFAGLSLTAFNRMKHSAFNIACKKELFAGES